MKKYNPKGVGRSRAKQCAYRNHPVHFLKVLLARLRVGLIGFAAFTLITVAAMRQQGVKDPDNRSSGTGGYRLILQAGIPLLGDLNTEEGRRIVGIREPKGAIWQGVHFTPLRMWAGQDISCLNLTRPHSPTVLGIPQEMIDRGGFTPGAAIKSDDKNTWKLLESNQGESVPVVADSDTQEYVLQIPLGGEIPITDQLGRTQRLRLVATIAHSIFQGQLLMSDSNFRRLFPAQSGFGMELVDVPKGTTATQVDALQRALSTELDEYSVVVDKTSDRLATYQNVQNTYLSTFQTLGALGLMLGTLGLAVVLVRTVIERKAELALLASLGFTSAARVALVLSENAFLLIVGLVLGAGCAVIGILPAVTATAHAINVGSLVLMLIAVLLIGFIASAIAVRISGVHVTPADLRRE